jgi:hypothetical protein
VPDDGHGSAPSEQPDGSGRPPPPPGPPSPPPGPTSPSPGPPSPPPGASVGGWGPPPGAGGSGRPPGGAPGGAAPSASWPAPWQAPRATGQPGHLLPYRPLTVGDILDGCFRLLRPVFGRAALLVLLVMGPYQLFSNLVVARLLPELTDPELFATAGVEFDPVDLLVRMGGWGVILQVLGLLVTVIVVAAVVALVHQADRDEPLDVVAALRTSFARAGATVGGSVLLILAGVLSLVVLVPLAIGLALVPILGIVVLLGAGAIGYGVAAGLYSLIVPVAVQEDRGAWTTFTRALWVLRVRFWRVVGVTLLVTLLLGIVSFAVALPLTLLSVVAGPFSWVVDGVSSTLISIVVVPVTAFAALLVYLDARVRREGLDLELRARRLGA